MILPTQIYGELKAIRQILKKPLSILIYGIVLVLSIFGYYYHSYSTIKAQVDKIWIEVLANTRELDEIISKEKDLTNIDYSNYKFLVEAYSDDFTTKIDKLDTNLGNFYTNLRKIEVFKKKADFDRTIHHGNTLKNGLRYYFRCEDYDNSIRNRKGRKERSRAISGSQVEYKWPRAISGSEGEIAGDSHPPIIIYYFRWLGKEVIAFNIVIFSLSIFISVFVKVRKGSKQPVNDDKDHDSDLEVQILKALVDVYPEEIRNIKEKPFAKHPGFLKCMKDLSAHGYIDVKIELDRGRGPEYSIRDASITKRGKEYFHNVKQNIAAI